VVVALMTTFLPSPGHFNRISSRRDVPKLCYNPRAVIEENFVQKPIRGISILAGILWTFLVVPPAFANSLSEADLEYLATQEVSHGSPVLTGLSPKERSRLHSVINDDRTRGDPVGQARNVKAVLDEFRGNQLWESLNPGKLWDAKTR
jgi:hypothetical protein